MTEPTAIDVLRAARDRYATNPSHAPYGRPPNGGEICAAMALDHGVGDRSGYSSNAYAAMIARVVGVNDPQGDRVAVIKWNASASTAEVLAAFDRAIAVEEAKAAEFTVEPVPVPA